MNDTVLNREFYAGTESYLLLDPPNGLSADDARELLRIALGKTNIKGPLTIAIMGLTPELRNVCASEFSINKIYLVDQLPVDVPYGIKEERIASSWLECPLKNVDVIFSDESINNLPAHEYPLFFEAMNRYLKPGGILVTRIMALYEETEHLLKLKQEDLLAEIRNAEGLSNVVCQVKVLNYLHSENIAYDKKEKLVDTARYWELLRSWLSSGMITPKQARPFFFPYPGRETPAMHLSSLEAQNLAEASKPYFEPAEIFPVDQSYCGADGSLNKLYRLLAFSAKNLAPSTFQP